MSFLISSLFFSCLESGESLSKIYMSRNMFGCDGKIPLDLALLIFEEINPMIESVCVRDQVSRVSSNNEHFLAQS
jgi:hypothetical protein